MMTLIPLIAPSTQQGAARAADYVPVVPDEFVRAAMGLVVIAAITLVGWVSTQAWMVP